MAQLSVANIVAETMDNYLLLGHILRCKVLPSDEVHADMWVGANRKFRAVPAVRLERARLEKPRTADERDKADRRASKRQAAKKAKLSALGIDYDIDAPAIVRRPPSSPSCLCRALEPTLTSLARVHPLPLLCRRPRPKPSRHERALPSPFSPSHRLLSIS